MPVLGGGLKRVAEAMLSWSPECLHRVRHVVYGQVIFRQFGFLTGTSHAAESSDYATTIVRESILEWLNPCFRGSGVSASLMATPAGMSLGL